jgi:hypothetical protein
MKNFRVIVGCLIVATVLLYSYRPVLAAKVEHQAWTELLDAHVRNGLVDYQGFKKDEARLDAYLATLDSSTPAELARDERLAFYINAYNAWTIKLILLHFRDGRPVKSIKDIGGWFSSPWSLKICRIGGELLALDTIEHGIIRPEFKDPRVHFAINCASMSCPPLLAKAYTGEKLQQQLDERAAAFINDSRFNYLQGDTLVVSKIFSWFSEDFAGDIPKFFLRYAKPDLQRKLLEKGGDIKIRYLDYDWSLNGWQGAGLKGK